MDELSSMLSIKECRQLVNKALEYFVNQGYKKYRVVEEFLEDHQIPQAYIDAFLQHGSIADGQKLYAYQIVITHSGIIIMAHINVCNLYGDDVMKAKSESRNLFTLFPAEQVRNVWNELLNVFITNGLMAIRDLAYERISHEATTVT